MDTIHKRYKIRKENFGAMLFDTNTGIVTPLTKEDYTNIITPRALTQEKSTDISNMPKEQYTSNYSFLYSDTTPLFKLYHSDIPEKKLPTDCLSAPSKVYIELTRKCTLSCKYCYNSSSSKESIEIPLQTVLKALDQLSEMGTFEIRFTGGEPTTYTYFEEVVRYAKKLGFYISLGTNGNLSEHMAHKIEQLNFDVIIISIDGPQEYNDSVRGAGAYTNAISSLKYFRKNKTIILKLNTVISKSNLIYVEHIVKLADSIGVDCVNFAPLRSTRRASVVENHDRTTILTLDANSMHSLVKDIPRLRKIYKTKIQTYYDIIDEKTTQFRGSLLNMESCAAGIEAAAIAPSGDFYGCVVSPANDSTSAYKDLFIAGNILKTPINEIWLDSTRWRIYRDITHAKSQKCKECKHYCISCFGNCVIDSFLESGKINSDPELCFCSDK